MANQKPIPFNSIEDLPRYEPCLVYIDNGDDSRWLECYKNEKHISFHNPLVTSNVEKFITHWLPMPPAPPKLIDDAEAFRLMINTIHYILNVHEVDLNVSKELLDYVKLRKKQIALEWLDKQEDDKKWKSCASS